MDLPPPTSAAAGWRPTLMPTVAMIISMYVRVQQYHASTRTPPTHLGSQQHTHRSILGTSTYNPLAIVPALPSSRLPRHEPRSAPPLPFRFAHLHTSFYRSPLASHLRVHDGQAPSADLATPLIDPTTNRPSHHIATFLPSPPLGPSPSLTSNPYHPPHPHTPRRHGRTTDPIDHSIRPGSDAT